jgi:hypothetical protein
MKSAAERNIAQMGEVYKYLEPGKLINGAVMFDMAAGKYATSMEKAAEIQLKQLQSTDELTKHAVDAQKGMELLSKNMLTLAKDLLPVAAKAVDDFTKALNNAIKSYLNPSNQPIRGSTLPPNNTPFPDPFGDRRRREQEEEERRRTENNPAPVPAPTGPVTPASPPSAGVPPISGTPVIGPPARPPAAPVPTPTGPVVPAMPPSAGGQPPITGPRPANPSAGQLVNFNSGSGDKAHFDQLNPSVRDAFMKMIGEYGKPVQITSSFRTPEEQQKLWNEGTPTEKPNIRMRNGIPVAMPGTSSHETGNALDINENVVNSLKSTASSTGDYLLKTYGFKTVSGDPIHIQKARFGAEFDGPDSGYPVMLHGPEVSIPKPEFEALKQTMNSVTKRSLAGAMPAAGSVAVAGGVDTVTALKSLHGIMSDKFDQMILVMERSADIQTRLLNNSMI